MVGVPRGLVSRLRDDLATSPVVLLEGLRAVGKTWVARELVDDGFLRSFVDLTDPTTLERFRDDPAGSAAEVAAPAVIDEVQLVPGLLLAIKGIVDAQATKGAFLLTGSARVRSDELGGTDPLVGRVAKLRLRPLTQGERAGHPVNLVERIFGGQLAPADYPSVTRRDLAARLAIGGLPTIPGVLSSGTKQMRLRSQSAYVDRVLAPQFGLPRRDEAGLARAFRYFAGNSAQILVVERAASQLGINRKTVDRYLDDLEARFLIERLPAWRPTGSAAARAHPKLHVTDSGIAFASASPSVSDDGEDPRYGGRVESFVIMELLSQAEWTDPGIRASHWRDPASKAEVDLVLTDSDNRVIAVEIKSSTSVSRHDLRGIDAFAERQALAGGLVFYTGSELRELTPGRWAVPIAALWTDLAGSESGESGGDTTSGEAQTRAQMQPIGEETAVAPESDEIPQHTADAALFLSYVRADDEAEHGRIIGLAKDIASRYELLTGESLPVFTDRDIGWGEQWELRLSQELARTTFFVPVVTPRFLLSEPCRAEVLEFVSKARALGLAEFVMPILYLDTPGLDNESDRVAAAVRESQWEEWGDLRYAERTSGEYRRKVDELVERLRIAREAAEEVGPSAGVGGVASGAVSTRPDQADGGADLLAVVERFSEHSDRFEEQSEALMAALASLGQEFEAIGPALERAGESPSPKQIRSVLRDAVGPLGEPAKALAAEAEATSHLLADLDEMASKLLVESDDSDTRELLGLDEFLHEVVDLAAMDIELSEMNEVRKMVRTLASVAREMRPIANSIDSVVRIFTDFDAMRTRWVSDAERVLGATRP